MHTLDSTFLTDEDRILAVVRDIHGPLSREQADRLSAVSVIQPNSLRAELARVLRLPADDVVVTGALERRLLFVRTGSRDWVAAELSGQPLGSRAWPSWSTGRMELARPEDWISPAVLDPEMVRRLTRPRILLAALYHPEYFPLPRFPLGISDLARAVRLGLSGEVQLMDMQLGRMVGDIVDRVRGWRPDILGISATFGQHDLMTAMLDELFAEPSPPLVLAGGSLTARNERLLLERYPQLLVARGAGEDTIQDVVSHWHGDLAVADIRGIGYAGGARGEGTLAIRSFQRNAGVPNRARTDIFPELDLLDETFAHHGVAQLEASRGCTNYCSFCPRGHKGTWGSSEITKLDTVLSAMSRVFDAHPDVSRTIYLVDEEFIGNAPDAVDRAREVADTLHGAGFKWETSCRVDQVVSRTEGEDWHLDRARMWRYLVQHGLRRCLFGVESGVDSVLTRFNKETTGEQNALAIRTLSALGVPTRFTYITFDQLMTVEELRSTRDFQARTDLLLEPLPELSVEEIVRGVRDPDFVAEHSTGLAFHTAISYLLVSMECLIGAAYTRAVEAAGLAGAPDPTMGRVEARYRDWRIGRCSHHAQLWVDRNFALDYTLKSLEKILDGVPRQEVRQARVVIKDAAAEVLTGMLALIEAPDRDWTPGALDAQLGRLLDDRLVALKQRMAATVSAVVPALPADKAALLVVEHERWSGPQSWRLINASDSCLAT